jgi:hypothetical protein
MTDEHVESRYDDPPEVRRLVHDDVRQEVSFHYHRVLWTFIPTFLLLAAVTAVFATLAYVNSQHIATQQRMLKADEHSLVATNFRLCTRANVTRGALVLLHPHSLAARLPFYDCFPDLAGQPATPLGPVARRALLRTLAAARSPGP